MSGALFNPDNSTANLLNRYNASIAHIPSMSNLKEEKDIGLFFTPTKHGVLNYSSLDFYYEIDQSKLQPDQVYIFPDPEKYGTGRGNTKTDHRSVIKHVDDVKKLKASKSDGYQYGDVIDDDQLQKFYPYQSREETLRQHSTGISRSTDDVDFWTGGEKDIWANSDVYPILPLQDPPLLAKINDLIISDDILHTWKTDIYGNDYALYKTSHTKRKTSEQVAGTTQLVATQNTSIDTTVTVIPTAGFGYPNTAYYDYQLSEFNTKFETITDTITSNRTRYDRVSEIPGTLYFRNLYSTVIEPASSCSKRGVLQNMNQILPCTMRLTIM